MWVPSKEKRVVTDLKLNNTEQLLLFAFPPVWTSQTTVFREHKQGCLDNANKIVYFM
jgi:hypothetical protein